MSEASDAELTAAAENTTVDVVDDIDVEVVDDAAIDDVAVADTAVDEEDTANEISDEITELVSVTQERDQFKDIALRLQADFENYRKRAAAQAAEDVERATGRLAEALLPVLDAAEAAYVQHPEEVGPLLNAMLTELKRHGLESVELEGQPFDPEVAEAVAHEPGEGGPPMVAEVMRSGYRWKGRTLRPAMVRTRD